jgi:general secretion pathway protein G
MKLRKLSCAQQVRRTGFTLMEIMLVVTIIALLAGLAIYKLQPALDVAAIAAARSDLQSFRTSLISYRSVAGTFPSTAQGLQALVKKPEGEPKPVMWHRAFDGDAIKQDPWRHDFIYKCPGEKYSDSYDLYSVGKDGIVGTDDDIWPQ